MKRLFSQSWGRPKLQLNVRNCICIESSYNTLIDQLTDCMYAVERQDRKRLLQPCYFYHNRNMTSATVYIFDEKIRYLQ